MKLLMIALTAAALASPTVHAACTPDEVNAKAEQLAERVNQLTKSNPERAKEINEEIRQMEAKLQALPLRFKRVLNCNPHFSPGKSAICDDGR